MSGVQALSDALSSGKAVLTELNLANNNLGVEGAKALADALKSGRAVLTHLDLSQNNLTNHGTDMSGILAIAEALKSGSAVLEKLVLDGNSIEDEGAVALGEALTSNKSLKELELFHCNIGTEGGKALAAALDTAVLTKLDAGLNNLGDEGKKVLRDAAEGLEDFELIV